MYQRGTEDYSLNQSQVSLLYVFMHLSLSSHIIQTVFLTLYGNLNYCDHMKEA